MGVYEDLGQLQAWQRDIARDADFKVTTGKALIGWCKTCSHPVRANQDHIDDYRGEFIDVYHTKCYGG